MTADRENPAAANSGAQVEDNNTQYTSYIAPSPAHQVQNFSNIPHELRLLPQWVNWREEKKAGYAKLSKVPYTPCTIKRADTTDPNTWGTYEDAVAAVQADGNLGIGFVFTDSDPYAGIDFDYTEDPHVFAYHRHWYERLNSYSERSPSGKGLHVIAKGGVPKGINSRAHMMEVYSSGRYFTFTGDVYHNVWIASRQPELDALYSELSASRPAASGMSETPDEPEVLTDQAVLESLFRHASSDKYRRLWAGDWNGMYGSQSEADFALIEGLHFCSRNRAQTARLFRHSGLYRETKRGNYIERTIAKLGGRPALPESVVAFGQQFASEMAAGGRSASPPQSPSSHTGTPPVITPAAFSPVPDSLIIQTAASVAAVPLHWLWPQRFALGKVSLIAGDPGLGKSQLTAFLAAKVTTGGEWPNGEGVAPPGHVVMLSCEDDLADTIRPRLEAAGADLDRVHVVSAVATGSGKRRSFNLTHDIAKLEAALEQLGGAARLVVIDPITAYMGGKIDNNGATEVRDVLNPVQDLAARFGVAIVCVSHPPKNAGQGKAVNAIIGSQAYVAATRAAWMVIRDPDNTDRRLFLQVKNNLGNARGLAFGVQTRQVPTGHAPFVMFENGYVDTTADEALSGKAQTQGLGRNKTDMAKAFLFRELANGPVDNQTLMQRAAMLSITERTLQKAATEIGVLKRKAGFNSGWEWGFPISPNAVDALFAPLGLPPRDPH